MRPSFLRHPVAVLRTFLKLGQGQFAEILGCSVSTIQSVETGRLKLSDGLAMRISDAMKVSVAWLLDGDPSAPMLDLAGRPYTLGSGQDGMSSRKKHATSYLSQSVALLEEIFEEAEISNRDALVGYKVLNALEQLKKENKRSRNFPIVKSLHS